MKRKIICGAAAILMALASCTGVRDGRSSQESTLTAVSPGDPVREENTSLPGDSMTTWDCVYFGSYPTSEISGGGFSAVDDYAVSEGDVTEDAQLYTALLRADWKDDETELDGVRYRRISFTGNEGTLSRPQHYKWENTAEYKYFRYEPIKWRVLETDGNSTLLMADRQLDCAAYNEDAQDVFWENCTMRSFLNGYGPEENAESTDFSGKPQDSFFGTAFSQEEQQAVIRSQVENPENFYFGTACGSDTQDWVYIPAEQEIFNTDLAEKHGFARSDATNDTARRFRPTMYAMARGAWYSPVEGNQGNGFWFVRTCGYTPSNVNYICDFGAVYNRGTYVTTIDAGIIPVIKVDIEKAQLKDAGKVTSADIFRETSQPNAGEENNSREKERNITKSGLSEPVTVEDDSLSSGMKTTWDCICYGSYPASEIIDGDFSSVEDYAVTEGSLISDSKLYSALESANWNDGETELDGVKYRRITADDSELLSLASPQHYIWNSPDSYHYFRYDPIKWRVLQCSGENVLLVADKEMDCALYNVSASDVSWNECTLRSFLNGYGADQNSDSIDYSVSPCDSFIGTAFTEEEMEHIISTTIENAPNSRYSTDCGPATEDRIFILSCDDVFSGPDAAVHGFYPGGGVDDPARRFRPTMYALAKGTWYSPVEAYRGNGFWFMRTNGYTRSNATYICDFGYIYNRGTNVTCNDSGILPAMWLDSSAAGFEPAGTVSSG